MGQRTERTRGVSGNGPSGKQHARKENVADNGISPERYASAQGRQQASGVWAVSRAQQPDGGVGRDKEQGRSGEGASTGTPYRGLLAEK